MSFLSGMWRPHEAEGGRRVELHALQGRLAARVLAWLTRYDDSDGIARVHGMANVQAEELVE